MSLFFVQLFLVDTGVRSPLVMQHTNVKAKSRLIQRSGFFETTVVNFAFAYRRAICASKNCTFSIQFASTLHHANGIVRPLLGGAFHKAGST
ncbi:MAG: hypothetical protein C9356_11010 [Oleiphilus sp.]|nr:MAG: hypothetical protein C9356_11010 [Oleiphilus sp.]